MTMYIQYKCPECGNTSFEIIDKYDWVGEDSVSGWEGDGIIVRCSKCHYDTGWYAEPDPTKDCVLPGVCEI